MGTGTKGKGQGATSALIGRQIDLARGNPAAESAAPPLNTKTAKFHRLIKLLQESGPGLSIRQMASTLGVDERTVKRYLADLRRLRFDLLQEADSRGRKTLYRIQGTGGPPVHLLSSLRKIRSELHAGGNPKHSSAISQVIRFLEDPAGASGTPAPGRRAASPAASPEPSPAPGAEVYHIDHGPFAEADPPPGILKILEAAVAARTAVKLTYSGYAKAASPRPEAEEVLFLPYILCLRVGTLYVIGRVGENRGPFKSFSVKRIRRCIATRDVFKPDPFNPADFYKYTFGQWHRQLNEEPETVVLALKAPWLEKYLSESRFHPPGRVLRKGGEALFEVKVVIKPDFINWVLSLAPDLVPLKPDTLRAAVLERLRQGLGAVGG
jgi:predicted DNA-binding transcriptional regulator YafY